MIVTRPAPAMYGIAATGRGVGEESGVAVTVFFGWLLILSGILPLAYAWQAGRPGAVVREALVGILYGGIGFYLLARAVAGLESLTLALAFYLVLEGVLEFVLSFQLRPLPGSGWLLFDGIVTLALAALMHGAAEHGLALERGSNWLEPLWKLSAPGLFDPDDPATLETIGDLASGLRELPAATRRDDDTLAHWRRDRPRPARRDHSREGGGEP